MVTEGKETGQDSAPRKPYIPSLVKRFFNLFSAGARAARLHPVPPSTLAQYLAPAVRVVVQVDQRQRQPGKSRPTNQAAAPAPSALTVDALPVPCSVLTGLPPDCQKTHGNQGSRCGILILLPTGALSILTHLTPSPIDIVHPQTEQPGSCKPGSGENRA